MDGRDNNEGRMEEGQEEKIKEGKICFYLKCACVNPQLKEKRMDR